MKKYTWFIAIAVLSLGLAAALRLLVFSDTRITCRIKNRTDGIIQDVRVDGAGNSIVIGDMPAGSGRQVTLHPKAQAGQVTISFMLPNGMRKSEIVHGYIESKYYGGIVCASIGAGGSIRVESNSVGIRYFP